MSGESDQEQFVVVAIHSFAASSANQLSLQKGELLTVLARDHSGWWIGRTANGKNGIFPSTYVQRVSNEPPPEEASRRINRERLLQRLELRATTQLIRGTESVPRLAKSASSTVYTDDLFGLEEEDLVQEQADLQKSLRVLSNSVTASFAALLEKQAELETDSQRSVLEQQIRISSRRFEDLDKQLEDAREEQAINVMNLKDANIDVPSQVAVVSSTAPKPPAPSAKPAAPKAKAPQPSASVPDQEWIDRALGNVDVARYLQGLSNDWQELESRLNSLEPEMDGLERQLAEAERELTATRDSVNDEDAMSTTASPRDAKKLAKKRAAADAEVDRLSGERDLALQAAEALRQDVEAGTVRYDKACEELKAIQTESQTAVASLSAAQERHRTLIQAIADAQKRAAASQDRLASLQAAEAAKRKADEDEYRNLERERRKVYNELQELRGNLRVYCRIRPSGDSKSLVEPVDDITLKITDPAMDTTTEYEFDLVLPETTTQAAVFAEVHPLVASVLDGYNVCVFAYGQTGSGKTHTMEGSTSDRGISFRTLGELFATAQERRADGYSTGFSLSVLEVYNDKIYDLLDGRKPATARWGGKDVGVVVQPQKLAAVDSVVQVEQLLSKAYENRSVAGTDCNQHSSRSHCLLTIHVRSENPAAKVKIVAKLHLIDLAGSERVKSSGVEGERFKEAAHINTSLTHLKTVIQALARADDGHVPFRNSALTSLLQDSLGGNCKCLMFANVSPLANNVPETICTLKYASEARKVVVGNVTARVRKG